MFCTACATLNAVPTARCAVCGARLAPKQIPDAAAIRADPAKIGDLLDVEGRPVRRTAGSLIRRALYFVPLLAVLLATAHVVDGSRVRQRALAASFNRGAKATAEGDYLTALDAFADA